MTIKIITPFQVLFKTSLYLLKGSESSTLIIYQHKLSMPPTIQKLFQSTEVNQSRGRDTRPKMIKCTPINFNYPMYDQTIWYASKWNL